MNNKISRKQIAYWVAALVIVGLILLVWGWSEGRYRNQQTDRMIQFYQYYEELEPDYYMVVLGDSVLGQYRDETSVPVQIMERLGVPVFNGAMGGTCMGRLGTDQSLASAKDVLSMVSLANAIATGNFRTQYSLHIEDNGTEHFGETIEKLSCIDFNQVEVLLLGYGVNDYHAGEAIESEDPYDEHTFGGALRSAIRTLHEAYPNLRIVLVTSPYTWYLGPELTCEEYEREGYVLSDYVEAQLAIAEEMGVEVIDLYHNLYPHEKWEDWEVYTRDGLHPNEAGRELLADVIVSYFEQSE